MHRSAAGHAELPEQRGAAHGGCTARRPGGPPGLRLSGRERRVLTSLPRARRQVHRAEPGVDRPDGRQGGGARRHDGRRRARHGRLRWRHRGRRRGRGGRAPHRPAGDDQGLGRRRRQGHPHRARGAGHRRRRASGSGRGAGRFRQRRRVRGEVHRGAAPHRDPGARRRARQHRASRRARLFYPAAPPEARRGGALAGRHARAARSHGHGGRGGRPRRRLRGRRHGRVSARPGRAVLLHGDEHPRAGRASGDRDGHRHRHRQDRHRGSGGGAAAVLTARHTGAGPRHRVPHQRRGPRGRFSAHAGHGDPLGAARRPLGAARHARVPGLHGVALL